MFVEKNGAFMNGFSLVVLFVAWYFTNAAYNVFNSFSKDDLPLAYTMAIVQMSLGLFIYALPLYILGFRKLPSISFKDSLSLFPIGMI